MTTIAANRTEMAADSLAAVETNRLHHLRKIHRVRGAIVGWAGDADHGIMFARWYSEGADFADRPKGIDGSAIVLDESGLYRYESECYPMQLLDDYHATGSGAAIALTAMRLGKTPEEAVELACELDLHTGPPVVVERL